MDRPEPTPPEEPGKPDTPPGKPADAEPLDGGHGKPPPPPPPGG